ncbi:MAG: hypothetical protein CMP48_06175 [Rickettsiales bacterium]|nr:hypothetical protein [Rickettsiales bacterium]
MKTSSLFFLALLILSSCGTQTTDDLVSTWLKNNATNIESVEAGNGFDDLKPIVEMVGDARIVALGEPTHGNREVFQLKHRLVEYLVTEKGFNIFALECPFGEALDINRYVLDGIGDPEKALAGIYIWTWDTQEVLALIKWMRAYNADPSHERKVKFYGFDPQDPERGAQLMLDYLMKVDPELEKAVHPELGILSVPFSDPIAMGRRQWIPEEFDSLSLIAIQQVMQAFESKKKAYVKASSQKEYEMAKQHARQAEIFILENYNDGINYSYERDHGQAENVRWTLDFEGDDSKIITWAHNIHVNNASKPENPPYPTPRWQGYHLKKWYQDDVKIIGFFYNKGAFTGLDEAIPSTGYQSFTVDNAKEGSLEHMMVQANLNNAFVDLSKLPQSGPIYDWFDRPIPTRYSWAFYDVSKPDDYYWPHHMTHDFDAFIFLNETTGTVPIDSNDYNNVWLLNNKLEQPTNLDFETGTIGEAPKGWITWSRFARLGVTMTISNEAYSGEKSLKMHRPDGPKYGEIGPNVLQVIDAAPYRGKKIRFTAVAKADVSPDTFAFLHLKIEPWSAEDTHDSSEPPSFDSLDKFRIESNNWKQYIIEASVAENASTIAYSVNLKDFGTVWLDDVAIEKLD